jgi:hypothetical protein
MLKNNFISKLFFSSKNKFSQKIKIIAPNKYKFFSETVDIKSPMIPSIDPNSKDDFKFETDEEKEIRFEDEIFYFEKNWKVLQNEKYEQHQEYVSKDLSPHQQRECDIILNKLYHMNNEELEYFFHTLKDVMNNPMSTQQFQNNILDDKKRFIVKTALPHYNPNYEGNQQILQVLLPFLTSGYFQGGGGAAAKKVADAPAAEKKKSEPKKETVLSDVSVELLYILMFFRVQGLPLNYYHLTLPKKLL